MLSITSSLPLYLSPPIITFTQTTCVLLSVRAHCGVRLFPFLFFVYFHTVADEHAKSAHITFVFNMIELSILLNTMCFKCHRENRMKLKRGKKYTHAALTSMCVCVRLVLRYFFTLRGVDIIPNLSLSVLFSFKIYSFGLFSYDIQVVNKQTRKN